MHEIRVTIGSEYVPEAVRLANCAGVSSVGVSDVFVHGPDEARKQVSVETSTPQARAFVDAFLASPQLARADYTLTSREVRAILDDVPFGKITRPESEPFLDVVQDLWQLTHITPSYIARATAGAILLATGVIEDSPIAIVVAALFLPFLSQVVAVSIGIWSRDWSLAGRGARAVLLSTMLAVAAGAIVALLEGGQIRFAGFKGPLASFAISAVIGVAAGLAEPDDTGRRYLIGVAAAVQFGIFPVWFGAAMVLGWPDQAIVYSRLASFGINLATISAAALVAFALLNLRRPHRLSAGKAPYATRAL
jgi:hypothetical protein